MDDTCDVHEETYNIRQPSGYLSISSPPSPTPSSTLQHSNSCYNLNCPWIFYPDPGQQFNFTFYSFVRFTPDNSKSITNKHGSNSENDRSNSHASPSSSDTSPIRICHKLAKVVDKSNFISKDIIACGYMENKIRKDKEGKSLKTQNYVLASSRTSNVLSAESAIIEITPHSAWSPSNLVDSQEVFVEFLLEFNC